MPVTVPIAGVLASLGLYGMILAVLALRRPERMARGSNFTSKIEWLGVLGIASFGMVGTAVTLAVAGGSLLSFVASTLVIGLLGVAFFKMLEITPTAVFAFLIDTRHFAALVRRDEGIYALRQTWEEAKIDGNVAQHQEDIQSEIHRWRARRGALSVATLITLGNAHWVVVVVEEVLGMGIIALVVLAVIWAALAFVLTQAGVRAAKRAPGVDWRRAF